MILLKTIGLMALTALATIGGYVGLSDNANLGALRTLVVQQGGTGAATHAQDALLVGNGTSPITSTTSPTVGYIIATSTTVASQFDGDVNIDGNLTGVTVSVGNIIQGYAESGYFVATSTTATSTFAGGFTIDSTDFVVDPDAGRVGIGTADPDSKLELELATGEKVHLDSAGDLFLDIDRGSSAGAGRIRYQTAGTDEFEVGLKGGVAGLHITDGSVNELVTVLSSGNVGIGTTTPSTKLSIQNGSVTTNQELSSTADHFKLANNFGTQYAGIGLMYSSADLYIGTDTYPELLIMDRSTGYVGIGTTTPNLKLHVNSGATQRSLKLETTASSGKQIVFRDSVTTGDTSVMIGSTGDAMSFYAGSSGLEFLTIDSAGDLGVGTTSPPHALTLGTAGDLINFGNGMCMGQDSGTTTPNVTIQNCSDF